MRKIKKLEQRIENLEKQFSILQNDFAQYKLNISTREYLIRTKFIGNIKSKNGIQLLKQNTFTSTKDSETYSFDKVVEQIMNYEFKCIVNFITKLHEIESLSELKQEKENKTISGKVVRINQKIVKDKPTTTKNSNSSGKASKIMAYLEKNPNNYFFENIDDFMVNMNNLDKTYRLSKIEAITLVNVIKNFKTKPACEKALKCAPSTLGRLFWTLKKVGILTGHYSPYVEFTDNCIIKKSKYL